MNTRINRRRFLGQAAATGAVLAGVHSFPVQAADSDKLNLAFVGVAGKGGDNINHLTSQNVVALCDVDANNLGKAAERFPQAKTYTDWRKMLDAEHTRLDGVVVSTADHNHAGPTAAAIVLGKHVYCEKPLTHTVKEARHIAELAAKHKVVTQMGTQVHAGGNYRRVVEVVQSGALGKIHEVYHWCNKGWSDGRFTTGEKPATLDWDVWLGPAKERPYSPGIHPFHWRRFWEYGSGTFGDMACHIMDLSFWALGLRYPTAVEATGPEVHPDGAPAWCMCRYDFPGIKFYWSDGGKHHDLVAKTNDAKGKPLSGWGLGVLFVGDKGMLAADYGHYDLLPHGNFEGFKPPKQTIPESMGHWNEWVQACKTGGPTTCNFGYSGALTETVLLGVVAFRAGERLEWDAKQLKATNSRKAEEFVTKDYRMGWRIAGM